MGRSVRRTQHVGAWPRAEAGREVRRSGAPHTESVRPDSAQGRCRGNPRRGQARLANVSALAIMDENKVIAALCAWLEANGYDVPQRLATTEQGIDIIAKH